MVGWTVLLGFQVAKRTQIAIVPRDGDSLDANHER